MFAVVGNLQLLGSESGQVYECVEVGARGDGELQVQRGGREETRRDDNNNMCSRRGGRQWLITSWVHSLRLRSNATDQVDR